MSVATLISPPARAGYFYPCVLLARWKKLQRPLMFRGARQPPRPSLSLSPCQCHFPEATTLHVPTIESSSSGICNHRYLITIAAPPSWPPLRDHRLRRNHGAGWGRRQSTPPPPPNLVSDRRKASKSTSNRAMGVCVSTPDAYDVAQNKWRLLVIG